MDVECGVMMDLSDARQTKDLCSRASRRRASLPPYPMSHVEVTTSRSRVVCQMPRVICSRASSLPLVEDERRVQRDLKR